MTDYRYISDYEMTTELEMTKAPVVEDPDAAAIETARAKGKKVRIDLEISIPFSVLKRVASHAFFLFHTQA